jgi:hypothetical protein
MLFLESSVSHLIERNVAVMVWYRGVCDWLVAVAV